MELKYQSDISSIPMCPPQDAIPRDLRAFRFVHSDIKDDRNFVVPAKLNPKRTFPDYVEQCAAYALSFFATQEAAEKRLRSLVKVSQNIKKRIGTHLAEGDLKSADGRTTSPSPSGHFDLFESKDLTLAARFQIVEELP